MNKYVCFKAHIEMDRLSFLPDSIIWAILSKLSLREAIRCATLSRRFKCVPQSLHILNISLSNLLSTPSLPESDGVEAVERIIDNLLFFHFSPLKAFILDASTPFFSANLKVRCFSAASVSRWIKWAARRNVEEITLEDTDSDRCTCNFHPRELPPSILSCKKLKTLHVGRYSLRQFTMSSSDSFHRLTTCTLPETELEDNILRMFMALCTQLQILEVIDFYGLHSPQNSASNLKHLSLRLKEQAHSLIANCPTLVDIGIDNFDVAIINCTSISLYRGLVKATVNDKNELLSLQLETLGCPYHSISIVWIMKEIAKLKALKRVALLGGGELFQEKGNLGIFLTSLPQLENLSIEGSFVNHLGAASDIASCTTPPLHTLKIAHVDYEVTGLELLR